MQPTNTFDLPYFDLCFSQFGESQSTSPLEALIGDNVHWGYWEDPARATLSVESYRRASEELNAHIFRAVELKPGTRLLDVGCGFGGTLRWAARHHENLALTGINIDPRQIRRARAQTSELDLGTSSIDFEIGDACSLNFPDRSFDVVSAVECIFHFPSRKRFFAEVARILRPGGRLVLSDFITNPFGLPFMAALYPFFSKSLRGIYGSQRHSATRGTYKRLAKSSDLKWIESRDITENTLPTYRVFEKFSTLALPDHPHFAQANRFLERVSRAGALRYAIYTFEK